MSDAIGRAALITCLALAGLAVHAEEDGRERIAAERRVVEDRYREQQLQCRVRFAVTACLEEAQARRRAGLAPLRERELRIDDAERQTRAAERRATIAAKKAAAASRPPPETPAPAAPRPARPAAPAHQERTVVKLREHAAAQAAEAADRASAAERQREAARLTQQRIARRLAEKAAQGKKSDPLPVPEGAAAAGR